METETTIIDGVIYDSATGEYVGHVDTGLAKRFEIDSEDAANWVLQKMLKAESAITAINQTPEVIAARTIIANAESMAKDHQKRLDGLHARFDDELAQWTRKQLDGKSKTWKSIYGSVSFRSVGESVKVRDEHKAIAWAKTFAKDAVKVSEKFLISLLSDSERDQAKSDNAFEVIPAHEKGSVKTNVNK